MPVNLDEVNAEVERVLRGCGFIQTIHCEKAGHHWDQESGPGHTIYAIITGFVYLSQALSERVDTVSQKVILDVVSQKIEYIKAERAKDSVTSDTK